MAVFSPILPVGINFTFWGVVAIIRFLTEKKITSAPSESLRRKVKFSSKVVVCVPAHNEEKVIKKTLKSLKKIALNRNIYVASDGSTDNTAKIAKGMGVNVVEIFPNRGKAGALDYLIRKFKLLSRYEFILFFDAGDVIDKNYLINALPYFSDPEVAAFAGHAKTVWRRHRFPKKRWYFQSYRTRLYSILQIFMRYPQTWKYTNVTYIVPGFASIYRARALSRIKRNPEGLVIEDFHMTFELHKKRLGKIAYHPSAFAIAQDPTNLSDYWHQIMRWNLGFWQTVRKHGVWPSFFWLSLGAFIIEVFLTAIFFLVLPFFLLTLIFPELVQKYINYTPYLTLWDITIGVVVFDYLITIVAAFVERRPLLLLYGFGYLFLRYVDALAMLLVLPRVFTAKSRGTWVPAEKR